MDRIFIEEYRGFDIYFDKSSEMFSCISGEYDVQKNKNSLTLAKKEIDEYIKNNLNFAPVFIEREPQSYRGGLDCIQLVGIRKDGGFTFINEKGEKEKLSIYNESDYWIKNEANIPIFEEIRTMTKEIEALVKKKSLKTKDLIKNDLGLKDLKSKYIK